MIEDEIPLKGNTGSLLDSVNNKHGAYEVGTNISSLSLSLMKPSHRTSQKGTLSWQPDKKRSVLECRLTIAVSLIRQHVG